MTVTLMTILKMSRIRFEQCPLKLQSQTLAIELTLHGHFSYQEIIKRMHRKSFYLCRTKIKYVSCKNAPNQILNSLAFIFNGVINSNNILKQGDGFFIFFILQHSIRKVINSISMKKKGYMVMKHYTDIHNTNTSTPVMIGTQIKKNV